MAEAPISELDTAPSVDRAVDVFPIVHSGTTYKITPNATLGLTGNPVGTSDTQTLTNKTLTSPTISGPTLSGTVAGTYTIGGTPTFPSSVVTLTGTQTLTNKTLTSPVINTATIANPTLTVDSISEYSSANGVAIDGVLLKDSKINGSYITDDTITDSTLDYPRWWQEIGRTTLTSAGDTITVSSIPARKYLYVVISLLSTGGATTGDLTFNGDTGANYAGRRSTNGAADATDTSVTAISVVGAGTTGRHFVDFIVVNESAQEKAFTFMTNDNTAGAANAPTRREVVAKWANTSAQITSLTVTNTGAGDYAIGSEVVVLGHD